jgi:RHS repeat-associated protein
MKFTGHERDLTPFDPNGLDYMHARFYNSLTGRFLSVDPTWDSADLGRPQAWNRYTYVRNNPIGSTDPDGRLILCLGGCWDAIKAAATSAGSYIRTASHYDDIKEAVTGMGSSATLSENAQGAAVIIIAGADIVANFVEPEETGIEKGVTKASDELLHHFGTEKKSMETLARKSAEAETRIGEHGVSATTAKPSKPHTSALKSDVEKHFPVKQTGADPNHHSVIMPKPMTQKAADLFNWLFGRI